MIMGTFYGTLVVNTTFPMYFRTNSKSFKIHSKLRSITHVATKVHVILQSFVVLTWMHDTIELV